MNRDEKFYAELKQMNDDLISYIKESNSKSPYFDFSPTFKDYMEQLAELTKKYPPGQETKELPSASATNTSQNVSTTSSNSALPIFTGFSAPSPISLSNNNSNNLSSTQPTLTKFSSAPTSITTTAPTIPTFGLPSSTTTNAETAPSPFSLTNQSSAIGSATTPLSTTTTTTSTTGSLFTAFGSAPTTTAPIFSSPAAPAFSMGTAQPFSFSFTMPKKDEQQQQAANSEDQTNSTTTAENGNNDADDAPPPEPKIDRYEEPNVKHSAKCKLYEKGKSVDGEVLISLLGIGYIYVKDMDSPNKMQVIFRQEPDLRKVLLNEVVTPNIPVKMLPKAVQMGFPSGSSGDNRFFIVKLKDEVEAKKLYDFVNLSSKSVFG